MISKHMCLASLSTLLASVYLHAQAYPFRPLDSIFVEIRNNLLLGGKAPSSESLLKMGFREKGRQIFVLNTEGGDMTVMLSGPEQKHVTMSWKPKEGIDVAPHVLSS